MVRAKHAGSGKSYACAHMAKLGYNVLFVSPTNVLCKELLKDHLIESITINNFFGFGVNEDNSFIKQFDSTDYNCIIFDEIYFYNIANLMKIYKYARNNPDKIIIANGDVNQLKPVDVISDVKEFKTYMNHCINYIFPFEIYLQENKRLKTKEDKIRL